MKLLANQIQQLARQLERVVARRHQLVFVLLSRHEIRDEFPAQLWLVLHGHKLFDNVTFLKITC